MLIRRIIATVCVLGAFVPGIQDRIQARKVSRVSLPLPPVHETATEPATTKDAKPVADVTTGYHYEDVKVCDGRSCHIEHRLVPNVVSKVARAVKAACPCSCADCTCNKQTSQPGTSGSCSSCGTTSTRRSYGPVRRWFGRGR